MKKRNILIVDDDSVSHLLIKKKIASLCWIDRIDSTYNGREAIQLLEAGCNGLARLPDLILLDLNMPVMNGFEFIESFNTMECMRRVPVVIAVLSSSDWPEDKRRVEALGVRHFLSKPLAGETLDLIASMEFRGVL